MRTIRTMAVAAFTAAAAGAWAQEAFDACEVFTEAEATAVLGKGAAREEAPAARGKRPRAVPSCTWTRASEGKAVFATATFRFARNDGEARRAFDSERLHFQTKPLLIAGAPAFWSAKQGSLQLLKGRTWVVIAAGGRDVADRDLEASRRLAEALVAKL